MCARIQTINRRQINIPSQSVALTGYILELELSSKKFKNTP